MQKSIMYVFLILFSSTILLVDCSKKNAKNTEDKVYKIAFCYFGPDEGADHVMKGFLEGLATAGISEGKNLEVSKFHAAGDMSNIPQMIKNADSKGFDLIIPLSTPCLAAAAAGVKKTNVVFCYVYDPIAAGAGKSFTDHLPKITGVGSFPPLEETIHFMQKVIPSVKRIGMIYNSSEANSRKVVEVGKGILKNRGLELVEVTITATNEVAQAATSLCSKDIQIVWTSGDNTVIQAFDGVVKAANNAKIPVIINDVDFVNKGALAAIGINWQETGRAGSNLAARVLKGEDPKNIPIENFVINQNVLNQEVAKKLGITFPAGL